MDTIKAGDFGAGSQGPTRGFGGGQGIMSSTWVHPNPSITAFSGGIILGVAALIQYFILRQPFNLIAIVLPIFLGGLLFSAVAQFRNSYAARYGSSSYFVIRPVGIAITLITSLFAFTFLVFGFFENPTADLRVRSRLGIRTVLSFAFCWFILSLFIPVLLGPQIIAGAIPAAIGTMSIVLGRMFLFYGIILMIPWGFLDGTFIYQYRSVEYWYLLAFMIALFILSIVI